MQNPVIVITGQPIWMQHIQDTFSDDYMFMHQATSSGYMNMLIDNRAALVLADGDCDDWQQWILIPGVSPATRRIPVILVSADTAHHSVAIGHGAVDTLTPDNLPAALPRLIKDYARVLDRDTLEALDCDCQEALPELAQEGVRKFNAGEYYKQHDLFEEQWVNTERPVRDLYRAILQVGVAYYQIERGNYRGALKMLQRSVQWLLMLPDVCQGVDVKQLREDSFRVRAELERLGEERFDEFDPALIKGVTLV
ncbi:MAG: DUF309 domain-containing protein [Aggregatilineales bacterium]